MAFRLKPSAEKLGKIVKNAGDPGRLPRDTSLDSITSILFPWRNIPQQRQVVAGNQAGRRVDPPGYFLCMGSVMLLTTATGICTATLWAIIYTLPLMYLTTGFVPTGTSIFSFCAGIFSIPCFFIAWTAHDTKKNYTFLPLLMILLSFSLTMLATSGILGLTYKSRVAFDKNIQPPQLLPSQYRKLLNETLLASMSSYDHDRSHRSAWDKVQQRLKCCGTGLGTDWLIVRKEIPQSCCPRLICEDGYMYTTGCMDRIAFELLWVTCFISGLSLIVCAIQIFTLCIASYMYIKERLNLQNSTVFMYMSYSDVSSPR